MREFWISSGLNAFKQPMPEIDLIHVIEKSAYDGMAADCDIQLGIIKELHAKLAIVVEALETIKADSVNFHIARNEYKDTFDPYMISDNALEKIKGTCAKGMGCE